MIIELLRFTKMVKSLCEFEYFTVFLKNRNFTTKIKRSKVTDYAALTILYKGISNCFTETMHEGTNLYNHHSSSLALCILETPKCVTLANSADPDEMQHDAAFHQGLHCLLRFKQPSWAEAHN